MDSNSQLPGGSFGARLSGTVKRRARRVIFAGLFALALAGAAPASLALTFTPRSEKVVLSGEANPFSPGDTFEESFSDPIISDAGLATFTCPGAVVQGTTKGIQSGFAFSTSTFDTDSAGNVAFIWNSDNSLYLANKKGFSTLAKINTSPTAGGNFTGFDAPSLNSGGQAAFHAVSTAGANDGVYLSAANVDPVAIALKNDSSPGGGVFKTFGNVALINDSGLFAFYATSAMTDGSTSGGIFLKDIKAGTALAKLPAASEASSLFMLNDAGQLAFFGNSTNGIWLGTRDGGSIVVKNGDAAPGGGTFAYFNDAIFGPEHPPGLSQNGLIAFRASTDNGPGNGIYLWTAQGVLQIAALGPAPGGSDFSTFEDPIANDSGQVVFKASVVATGGFDDRLYLGDGTTLVKIIGVGDRITGTDGHTTFSVTSVSLKDFFGLSKATGHGPLNNNGQVAYVASYQQDQADGSGPRPTFTGVFIYTAVPKPPVITSATSLDAVLGQKFTFAIQATNKPTKFSAVLDGTQSLPTGWTLSAAGLLTVTPKQAGTFTIDLKASNDGGAGTATLTVTVVDLSGYAGKYSGLIAGSKGDVTDTGIVNVKVTASGGFTAAGSFGGVAFSVKGKIKSDGTFSFQTKTGETIKLQLDQVNVPGSIAGEIDDATSAHNKIASLTLSFTPLSDAKNAPSKFIGTYTFLLPADPVPPAGTTYPAASGCGTIKINGKGAVTLSVSLADGEPTISAGGWITDGGVFFFDHSNKTAKSFLAGSLTCEAPLVGDNATGALSWQRAGQTAPCHIAAVGSRYRVPEGTATILPTPLTFQATGGGITAPAAQQITISAADEHPANAVKFDKTGALKSISIATKTGLLSGSFGAAVPGAAKPKTFSFKGVALQKQKRAEGFFKGPTDAGSVTAQ